MLVLGGDPDISRWHPDEQAPLSSTHPIELCPQAQTEDSMPALVREW